MTTISVIIPTVDEVESLPALVRELLLQGFDEIIVVDASLSDATALVARQLGATCLSGLTPCRGAQMQVGASIAQAQTLFFLHADSKLLQGAANAIRNALAQPNIIAGSFRLAFDHPSRFLSFYAWCSRLNWPITTFGDQGLFVTRDVFDTIGGFKPMALLEDFEIQRRLRSYGQFLKLSLSLTTSARRFVRRGIVRQQILNVVIIIAYLCGGNPTTLATWYKSRAPSL